MALVETSRAEAATSTGDSDPLRLLGPDDPAPVCRIAGRDESPFLLSVDHAGLLVPVRLGDLGVAEAERRRHIGWDIGAAGLAGRLAALLGAPVIAQRYSRLVIDCNRRPGHPGSIPPVSDGTAVPANRDLSALARRAREREILEPYQSAIGAEIDRREAAGLETVLVAVHSFTPSMGGRARPWHAGMLFNRDPRLGSALLALLEREGGLVVAANEPYRLSDVDDYTVPVHGEGRGLLHVELEIRQDLIADQDGETAWAQRLARLLPPALDAARAGPAPYSPLRP